MTDLKIPNINIKSKQYLFKNKIPLTRKPKIKLLKESSIMLTIAVIIISINYAIPEKLNLFKSFMLNINNIVVNIISLFSYLYEVLLVLFILISSLLSLILIIGAFYRISKTLRRKTKKINF
tara:strand:- start:189 stop:554 length:366 start_codon:yes stop_codon:yes gene_type:complete